jgi:predicted Zn-dependent protease
MCTFHDPAAGPQLGRRRVLVALVAAGGSLVVSACAGDGTGLGLQLVPEEQVVAMGLETWERLRQQTPPSHNRVYVTALNRVGSNLLATIGEDPRRWEMVVFQGDEANAFALPGGKIGVFEGMFDYAEDEQQLAAVVGHEIGHNRLHHAAERLNSEVATQIGLQAMGAALQVGNIGYANEIAALLGAGLQYGLILPYSRNQELEADAAGLEIMAAAGYDPRAAIQLWRNMERAGPRQPGFLSTHPAPGDRITRLEQLMPRALAIYEGKA